MTQATPEAYRAAEETYDVETSGQFAMHHEHGLRAAVDAVWKLADDAGYRRAVLALRYGAAASVIFESSRLNDHESAVVAGALAEHLESLAAAPRNEGAQT